MPKEPSGTFDSFSAKRCKRFKSSEEIRFSGDKSPYGERIEERENLPALYETIGKSFAGLDAWSMYLITAYADAERYIGRKADKNRKIYNGMMKTYYYQVSGAETAQKEREFGGKGDG